jgi:hypothetical protein
VTVEAAGRYTEAALELELERRELERLAGRPGSVAFGRTCTRAARLKRRCDCGHWVDGSRTGTELYRYQVWKLVGATELEQRTDCEPCARVDARY